MAHYAFLNKDNIVTNVIVGKDEDELDANGNVVDWEQHYSEVSGEVCKRTSYNTYGNQHNLGGEPFRKNYAGIGFVYDSMWDAFYQPQPFLSWKLNYETFLWEAPIPAPEPTEEYSWLWSEVNKNWEKIQHSL
jgi:hypothetical protein